MAKRKLSARSKASMKWTANHTKQMKINLNLEADADIIEKLESTGNKQGYIKGLIRADIAKEEK